MSNNASATASTGGIGFFGLLTIVLVILKATGVLNISWWLVFSPILVSIVIAVVAVAILVFAAGGKR